MVAAYDLRSAEPKRSLLEFLKLIEEGSIISLVYAGYAYEYGIGTEIDQKIAADLYGYAIKKGCFPASIMLAGLRYRQGKYRKALALYSLSLKENHGPGIYFLARFHAFGPAEFRDLDKAIQLFERAISLGHLFAKADLSNLLLRGNYGVVGVLRGINLKFQVVVEGIKIFKTNKDDPRLKQFGL